MLASLVTLALCTVPDSVFENPAAWQTEETDGDLKLDSRAVEGSSWLEYRVTTTTDSPPETLCSQVYEVATKGKGGSNVSLRKLLKDAPEERVLYDQVEAPMVSKRDYAMTVKKLPAEGACRIRFKITNDQAPTLPDGVLRMERMWGGWNFVSEGGKTRVTHFLYADPGGAVPAFIARPSQRKAVKEAVQRMVQRAKDAKDAGR